jgi:hypothetical protein
MVARSDPRIRLRDYEHALSTWLQSDAVRKIVLFENSGHDISSLRAIALRYPSHRVEFISFSGNRGGSARGKGYAELAGIERTLEESKLIQDDHLVVKCTGRLTVRNAKRLLESIQGSDFDIMCSLHAHLTYAESRLFVATPAFIANYLLAQQALINDFDQIMFENALACAVAAAVADRKGWRPFPVLPVIEGISGTTGNPVTIGAGRRLIKAFAYRVRRFVYQH